MPRPRFHKLPPAQQAHIVAAALEEFSAHGLHAASLNRIIDAAGISKGSMYYYFDDKEDLYVHVARVEIGRMFEAIGPFPVPDATDPDAFWSTLERHYLRIVAALTASSAAAALARDWAAAAARPAAQQAQRDLEGALLPWFEQAFAVGQRAGAIRKDVPLSLSIAVVFGMGQAMDTWLVNQRVDEKALRKLVRVFTRMARRALGPEG